MGEPSKMWAIVNFKNNEIVALLAEYQYAIAMRNRYYPDYVIMIYSGPKPRIDSLTPEVVG
jgi:hypothetical protein